MADHIENYDDDLEIIDPSQPFTDKQRENFDSKLLEAEKEGYENTYSAEDARKMIMARINGEL